MNELKTAITPTKDYLPTTVEELNTFILIGKQKLIAHKAKIRAIEQTRMAIAAQEAALADTQDMADILLDAEVKMGEILGAIEPKPPIRFSEGNRKTLPDDITKKQSHQAQTLARNKEIVEQAKAEARDNGEIVTASKVYQIIKDKPGEAKDNPVQLNESLNFKNIKAAWHACNKSDKAKFIRWVHEYFPKFLTRKGEA